MRYPDYEFEEHLSRAALVEGFSGTDALAFAGHKIAVSLIDRDAFLPERFGYGAWLYWMESFDNEQREALRQKLVALRVEARLKG